MKTRNFVVLTLAAGLLLTSCGSVRNGGQQAFEGTAIVAHRGYWNCDEGGHATNSVAALRCAQEHDFWGSEFDVNMTKDEVLVVFHDNRTEGMKFEEHPYADYAEVRLENGEPIPTLEDYLRQARKCKTTKLVFELKPHSTPEQEDRAIQLSLEQLKRYRLLKPERVMFISFSVHACRRFVEWAPGIDVQYLGSDIRPEALAKEGIMGIDSHMGVFANDETWIKEARTNGMSVNIWTVDKDDDIRRFLPMQVDHFTTNEPERVRALLKEAGMREVR